MTNFSRFNSALFISILMFAFQITVVTVSSAMADTIILNDINLSTSLCSGLLVDDGGVDNNYSDDQNNALTIQSPGAAAYQLNFQTFLTELCCDNLTVTGFTNGVQSFFETFRGNQSGAMRTIPAEYLEINFSADGSSADLGFEIAFSCITPSIPVANFSASNTIPCDSEVNLSDQSSGFPDSWSWYLNDILVSNEMNPSIDLMMEGFYSVKLVACNALGCDTLEKIDYINYIAGQEFCDTTYLINNLNAFSAECTGVIVDDGGINGHYSNDINSNLRVNVPGAIGYRVTVKNFNTEACCTELYILKDDGNGQQFVQSFTGNVSTPNSFDIYGNEIIFNWLSNGGQGAEGFDITWECLVPSEPSADFFAGNTQVCNGFISLFDQSSGVPDSWEWLINGVVISTEQNPEFLLTNEGIYDVELRACNSFGCDTIIKENYITYEAIGFCDTFYFNGFQQINSCQGVLYDNGGPDGDYQPFEGGDFELNFPGGDGVRITVKSFNVGNDASLFIEDPQNGIFLYNLTGEVDSFSFEVATSQLYMGFYGGFETAPGFEITYECIDASLPVSFFDIAQQAQCSPIVEFSNLTSGLASEWTWKVNGNFVSDQFLYTHELEPGVSTTISLTGCNAIGCDTYTLPTPLLFDPASTDCAVINLSENNFAQFSNNCEGTLYDSGGPNGNYSGLSFPTIRISNQDVEGYEINVEEMNLAPGDYLEVYQANDYSFTYIQTLDNSTTDFNFYAYGTDLIINFYSNNVEGAEGFKINWACKTDSIPPFLQVNFFDDFCSNTFFFESFSFAADQIIWDLGDGTITTGETVSHTYTDNGDYTVTAMAINDIDTSFFTTTVQANFKEVEFDAPTEIFVNLAFTAELTSHEEFEYVQNFWYLNGEFIGDGQSITFNLSQVGNNELRCEMLDNYGCETIFVQTIEGLMNSSNINPSDLTFSIYPNPTPDKIRIEGLNVLNINTHVQIHDALGQQFFNQDLVKNNELLNLDLTALKPGVYFITIEVDAQKGTKRFVKL